MSYIISVGSFLNGFVPFIIIMEIVYSKPYLTAVFIFSTMAWLFAFIISSIFASMSNVWYLDILFAVIAEEVVRYFLISMSIKMKIHLVTSFIEIEDDFASDNAISIAIGTGFSIMRSSLFFISLIICSDGNSNNGRLLRYDSSFIPSIFIKSCYSVLYLMMDLMISRSIMFILNSKLVFDGKSLNDMSSQPKRLVSSILILLYKDSKFGSSLLMLTCLLPHLIVTSTTFLSVLKTVYGCILSLIVISIELYIFGLVGYEMLI